MVKIRQEIVNQLRDSAKTLTATTKQAVQLAEAAEALISAFRRGNKILTFGNGGSSCDAQNFADELVGRYCRNRPPLPALCLSASQADLTSIANDFGYEEVFKRQLEAHAKPGDVAIAISTSGNSKNVLAAVESAKKLGLLVIGLTGNAGGKLTPLCDISINIQSKSTARIQEAHITVIQIWCGLIEDALFPNAPKAHG